MKVRGTFEGHTSGSGWGAIAVLVLFIAVALGARDGSGLARDAGHAAGVLIIGALAVTAVIVTAAVTLVAVARRHEARWMAQRRMDQEARPAQLTYQRPAAPAASRREIHVYHHLEGLPRSVADSPVTAEILRDETGLER